MLLTLNIAPGVQFHATSASMGLTDGAALAMKTTLLVDDRTDFIWQQVKSASDRLFFTPPANQRPC